MSLFKRLKGKLVISSFTKSVITLMTGTTVAQIIPIAISPILTRLYSPSDFGILGLFSAIVFILGPVANAKYEQAIILPEKDEEAINVTVLSIVTSFTLSVVLFLSVIFFGTRIAFLLGNEEIAIWLYYIPLVIFLTGAFNAFSQFNVRLKQYKNIAKATVNKSLSLAFFQLILGYFKLGASGLVTGQIISNFTGNSTLAYNTIKNKQLLKSVSKEQVIRFAKRYINFPKYYMWAILANSLSYNIISFFISSIFSTATLGFYALGNRVLGMPTSLIGNSIGQVFFKEAVEEKKTTGYAVKTFKSTVKKLLVIAIPFFTLLYFIVEDTFAFVFGSQWRTAGEFAQILIPVFFVRFVLSPLTYLYNVFEKQKLALIWQIALLGITLLSFWVSTQLKLSIKEFLYLFTTLTTIHYFLLFVILMNLSKSGHINLFKNKVIKVENK
ncbi:MAG: oligosaccharide flippase family protein [Clostridia bacterium]|nr:oligosaccharide flippase family protein [Clostridia bacterium]